MTSCKIKQLLHSHWSQKLGGFPQTLRYRLSQQDYIHCASRALQVLSDDQKRSRYDMHGEVDPNSGGHQHRGGGFSFHAGHGHTFTFSFNPFHHHSQHQAGFDINNKFFFDKILPGSSKQPYLILFYHNFCFNCGEVQMTWENIRQVRHMVPHAL